MNSSARQGLPPRYDVFLPNDGTDLCATYRRLRDAAAACRAGPGSYAVGRYADVAALLRDSRLGHHPAGNAIDEPAPNLLAAAGSKLPRLTDAARPSPVLLRLIAGLDAPEHTRVRRLVHIALAPELFEHVGRQLQAHVSELLGGAIERRTFDAVDDLALPLQVRVAADLLDVPSGDRAEVARRATELGRAIILLPFVTEEWGNGDAAAAWLRGYVAELVRERRRRPGGDAISRLLGARRNGDALSEAEVIDNAVFLMFAGFETMFCLIANGCSAFAQSPLQWRRLRADPSLAPAAVEETLRFEAPLQWVSRLTKEPIELGDQVIGRNRVLLLLIGSANHDERQFDDPDTFDISRHPNPHLSFGGGHHLCMGQSLVRAEAALVFGRLAQGCRELELTEQPTVRRHPCIRGFAHVPLAVAPAAST